MKPTDVFQAFLRCRRKQSGFAVVLLIALLTVGILFAVVSGLGSAERDTANKTVNGDTVHQARELLLGYAITYPDNHANQVFGYLPCPDMDGDGVSDGLDGSCGGTDGKAVVGLLPYKTLGLSGNIDSDGNCLWYAVSGTFKASANKPTPLNWDTQGQIEIRDNNNNLLAQPNDVNGGAAAAIIVVGPPRSSQNRLGNGTVCGPAAGSLANSIYDQYIDVDPAKADTRLSEPFPGPANGTVRLVEGMSGSDVNNDHLVWITPRDIWERIRKRSDLAGTSLDPNINSLMNYLQSKLTGNLSSYAPGANNSLPGTHSTYGVSDSSSLANYFDNFFDQFRYLRCPTLGSYCYKINGMDCDGVLMFSGGGDLVANGTNSPRPTTQRSDANYFENDSSSGLPLLQGPYSTTTNAASGFNSATPSRDAIQCLSPQPPVQVSAAQMFDAINTIVSPFGLVSTSGTALTLGSSSVPTGAPDAYALYGCYWYPTPVPLGNGIRVFFQYTAASRSEGFTFTLADADPSRNPSTTMCGAGEDALGYAGNNGTTSIVNYPKIAIEADFAASNPGALGLVRNDPTSSFGRHFAFDYWGADASTDPNGEDDLTHGAGGGTSPTNPAIGTPGLKSFSIGATATAYVRLDVIRTYNPLTKLTTYDLNGYVTKDTSSDASGCFVSDYANVVTADLTTLCSNIQSFQNSKRTYLHDSITIADISGAGEAMRRVYLGFTTGQHSSGIQSVVISNFQAATR